jgi:hypothetical protein
MLALGSSPDKSLLFRKQKETDRQVAQKEEKIEKAKFDRDERLKSLSAEIGD